MNGIDRLPRKYWWWEWPGNKADLFETLKQVTNEN